MSETPRETPEQSSPTNIDTEQSPETPSGSYLGQDPSDSDDGGSDSLGSPADPELPDNRSDADDQ